MEASKRLAAGAAPQPTVQRRRQSWHTGNTKGKRKARGRKRNEGRTNAKIHGQTAGAERL